MPEIEEFGLFGESGDDSDDAVTGSVESALPTDEGSAQEDPRDKRIKDLMSKWQKAEARARKAEAAASGPKSGETASDARPAEAPSLPSEVAAWVEAAREAAVERIYESDTRFAEYGIDRTDLDGATPAEVRANAERLRKLIDGLEGKVRNRVLSEHGFAPEIGGESRVPKKSFADMTKEEFDAEIARALG